MKTIKHWWVKLYQHTQHPSLAAISSNWVSKKLIAEGYSKDKVTLPHRDGFIELLTDPYGDELTTLRADVVDSIVCTPVYEGEEEVKSDSYTLENIKNALSKNTHLLKSEFFTIECALPTPEELDKIFAQLCEEFEGVPLSCPTFSTFFNEIVERTKGLNAMKMNVNPECMFSQNALRGKSIRPKH
ncbi:MULTISPECIES: hypothetical protein [Enterobacter cloacae complex]|uniref:hypothetical protein n=1 Tax=Enterobacter cloacae complex TaxID=354276 RepID=UPI0019D1196C|nr:MULTISPECIES: hypothetical protein [Enterobacter cloacae complex]MCO7414106.1 hypothetical protein [Enterobacter asburiae]UBM18143.1 hypothetical protein LBF07_18925 [Enterobacter cloacae complex sp. ECL352]HBK4845377.1 hypothetical protein [Enterobacter asburiae]